MLRKTVMLAALAPIAFGVPSAEAQVKLQRKFTEGSTEAQRISVVFNQKLTIAGMEVDTQVNNSLTVRTSVGKRGAGGTLPLAIKIESLLANLSLPGGINIQFDSANPNAKAQNEQLEFLLDIFRATSTAKYTLQLNDKNEVAFVEGLQEILDDLSPMAAAMLKSDLNEERIAKDFHLEQARLPDKPVKKGDSWSREEEISIGAGQTMTFQVEYEYVGTVERDGKELDNVKAIAKSVTYASEPNPANPAQVTESDLKIASSNGSYLFDREHGNVVESSLNNHIKGSMTLSINGMDLPAELDLKMEMQTTLEK